MIELYKKVTKSMSEPHRKYHTMRHIGEMFALASTEYIGLSRIQHLAILLHDVVYNIPSGDISNEELSAVKAGEWLRDCYVPCMHSNAYSEETISAVQQIIRDTEKAIPTTKESAIVIDLDLSGLALNYWENRELIFYEFAHIGYDKVVSGRRSWLISMLERDSIFVSDHFQFLEKDAVKNIKQELQIIEDNDE